MLNDFYTFNINILDTTCITFLFQYKNYIHRSIDCKINNVAMLMVLVYKKTSQRN